MTVHIPRAYEQWYNTNPSEGRIMVIALLTKLAYIYGTDCYLEFHNDDLETVNCTSPPGRNQTEIKILKDLGLIEVMRGLEMKTTVRISNKLCGTPNRIQLFKDSIEVPVSQEAALIWCYLMGRLANVDAEKQTEIEPVSKIRKFESTAKLEKWHGREKTSQTHILPPVYQDSFKKIDGNIYTTKSTRSDLIKGKTKHEYGRDYYLANKERILARKINHYKNKKKQDDKNV